jgi:hypothetical protein
MSSDLDEILDEAAELSTQAVGAGTRYEEACRLVAARDLRGFRKQAAEAFFEKALAAVEAKRGARREEGKQGQPRTELLVFIVRAENGGGPRETHVEAEEADASRIPDRIGEKRAYGLPLDMFWDFVEWFKEGISNGSFDSRAVPGERVEDLIYSEFKAASKSWLERKGWDNLSTGLESLA